MGTYRPCFLKAYQRLLRIGGMWPPKSAGGKIFNYSMYRGIIYVFLVMNVFGELGGLLVVSDNLEARSRNIGSTIFRMLAVSEMTVFLKSGRHIRRIFEEMEILNGTNHGVDSEPDAAKLRQSAATSCNRLLVRFASWFTFSSAGFVLQPVVNWYMTGHAPRPFLSSDFWLIVDAETNIALEMIIYTSQSVCQFVTTLVVVTFECFFASLTIYAAFQLQILCVVFDNLNEVRGNSLLFWRRIVHCVKFHQNTLRLADELQRYLRFMMMLQFLASLTFITTMMYQLAVLPPSSAQFFATVMVLICSNTQMGVYCFASDKLIQATTDVSDHVSACDWIGRSPKAQKLLPFIIQRSSRPGSLWCWKLFRVNMPCWLTILNKSYSFYAVMRSSEK